MKPAAHFAQHTNWIRGLPAPAADAVLGAMQQSHYAPGEMVYRVGDRTTDMYQVVSGSVQLREGSDEGKEVLLVIYGPGECFGSMPAIDGGPRPQDAVAAMPTTLGVLSKHDFDRIRDRFPVIDRALLVWALGRLRDMMRLYHAGSLYDLRRRLAGQIDFLLEYNGDETAGRACDGLHITHDLLAASIGATRQAISKVLRDWSEAGVVRYRYGHFEVLDRARLRELAGRPSALNSN